MNNTKRIIAIWLVLLNLICIIGCKSVSSDNESNLEKDTSGITTHVSEVSDVSSQTTSDITSSDVSVTSPSKPSSTSSVPSVSTFSSIESITESQSEESEVVENTDSEVELVGVNKLRPDYDLGDCRNLSGDVSVLVFYIDDFESTWSYDETVHFTEKEIKPGLKFLEDSAKKYGVSLNLEIKDSFSHLYYGDEVETNTKESGYATIDALDVVASQLGYDDDLDLVADYKKEYSTEVICFCVFNKEGTSYGLNPRRGTNIKMAEHVLMFACDENSTGFEPVGWQSSVIAHETLHLYGAEDYYNPAERKAIAKKYCPNDIMLSCKYYLAQNDFGDATAFYIGWIDEVPPMLYEENW